MMNTTHKSPHDESDEALDRVICAATVQPPPLDVKNRVIEVAAAFASGHHARMRPATRRSWLILASAAAAISAACLIAFLLLPSASVGWADVSAAVKSQKWIRATVTWSGKQSSMWLSPERQVWAFRTDNWFIFSDGRQRAKYEYRTRDKQIAKMPLGEEDERRVLPVDYLSQGPWLFGTERVVSQKRREVTEAGKKWIEFEMVFWRGDMKLGTLRVDPETRLPVYLLLRSPTDSTKSMKYDFDYPADGPADIYALGVPAGITVDDRMPSEESLRVLRAIAASRARIGDFRLVVAASPGRGSYIVWRKGDRWRIDICVPQNQTNRANGTAKPPDGRGWGDPFAEQLSLCWLGPLYICDGRTAYKNADPRALHEEPRPGAQGAKPITWQRAPHAAPRDLLSGEGLGHMDGAGNVKIVSLVYPDLSPKPGFGFEYDAHPADSPGCVLIKSSASLPGTTTGHEWYYIDPAKGYAVVRAEFFRLPANATADPKATSERQSIRMEDFQQSPQGFWYPKVIHQTTPSWHGPGQTAGAQVSYNHSTVHYHFDFGVALPDSLFVIDGAGGPNE